MTLEKFLNDCPVNHYTKEVLCHDFEEENKSRTFCFNRCPIKQEAYKYAGEVSCYEIFTKHKKERDVKIWNKLTKYK